MPHDASPFTPWYRNHRDLDKTRAHFCQTIYAMTGALIVE
jgi:hypothetical protein